jgi:hypothetical protein
MIGITSRDRNRAPGGVCRLMSVGAIVCALLPSPAVADDLWGSIRIPGGADAFRQIGNLGAGPRVKAGVLIDLVRSQYRLSSNGSDVVRDRLDAYVRHLLAVERALAGWPEGLTLSAATGTDRRRQQAFQDTLELFGMRVRTSRDRAVVEIERGSDEMLRQQWLGATGVNVADVAERLNKGETVRVSLSSTDVPWPLPALWSDAIRPGTDQLVQFLKEPRHQFMYLALSRLDRDTLAWIGSRPDVFRKLHEDRYLVFGGFAQGLQVRDGQVVTPGGAQAAYIWESLVDAPVTDAARFVSNLFEKDDGRLAYFYATTAALDGRRQDFVLGATVPDTHKGRDRRKYVEGIRDWFVVANPSWKIAMQPLSRPPIDPALVLSLVDVSGDGAGPDWWPSLFQGLIDTDDWPARPKDTLSKLKSVPARADWVLSFVFREPEQVELRWNWLRFAQRRMSAAPRTAAHDVEIALRAIKDMPVLSPALERMGVESPAVFAQVAWAARRLSQAASPEDVEMSQRAWQGALASLEQVHRHRSLTTAVMEPLLMSLAKAVSARPLEPSGSVAGWWLHSVLPALGASVAMDERAEESAIRALVAPNGPPPATFDWEGVTYRVDMRGPVAASIEALRAVMPGPRLQHLATLDGAAARLAQPFRAADELATVVAQLESVLLVWSGEDLAEAIRNLRKLRPKDLNRAVRERVRVLRTIDEMASQWLPSFAYAVAMSPATQPARVLAAAPAIHEMRAQESNGTWISYAWSLGKIVNRTGGGTTVRGSLLGLDLVRAEDLLARAPGSAARATAGTDAIQQMSHAVFVDRLVLRGAASWTATASAATRAVTRGRSRVQAWLAGGPDDAAIAREWTTAGFSTARQNQIRWLLERKDEAELSASLSLSDFYRLGSTDALPSGWGQSARMLDGCWCLQGLDRAPVDRFLGYNTGYTATAASDLLLRLAEILAAMRVPPEIMEPALAYAVRDAMDRSVQFLPDDWEALTWAGLLTPERVDDYLQGLVSRQFLAPPTEAVRR